MKRTLASLSFLLFLPTLALAQPTLDSLWPNEDGRRWSYEGLLDELDFGVEIFPAALQLNGTILLLGGGTGQNLEGITSAPFGSSFVSSPRRAPRHLPGFWRNLWIGRPDLRVAIEHRFELQKGSSIYWPFLLLGPGPFVKDATIIGMWSEIEPDWGWWYLTEDLTAGATWTRQLVPTLADDVFLHATVASLSAMVETQAGTFSDAVQMDYVVDQGVMTITNEVGQPIGTVRSETAGTVYFVPSVGPVHMVEDFHYVELDCPTCPPGEFPIGESLVYGELDLTRPPVTTEERSWGHVKALYGSE